MKSLRLSKQALPLTLSLMRPSYHIQSFFYLLFLHTQKEKPGRGCFDLTIFIDFLLLFFYNCDTSITEFDHEWVQSFQNGSLAAPNKACKLTTRKPAGEHLCPNSAFQPSQNRSTPEKCQYAHSIDSVNF